MIPYTSFYKTEMFKNADLSTLNVKNETALMNFIEKDKNFLVVLGCTGAGKTHICAAYIHHLLEKKEEFSYLLWRQFSSLMTFLQERGIDYRKEIKYIASEKYLILDDIVNCEKSNLQGFEYETFYQLINGRYNNEFPTVITLSLKKEDLSTKLCPKLASRLLAKENILLELDCVDRRNQES